MRPVENGVWKLRPVQTFRCQFSWFTWVSGKLILQETSGSDRQQRKVKGVSHAHSLEILVWAISEYRPEVLNAKSLQMFFSAKLCLKPFQKTISTEIKTSGLTFLELFVTNVKKKSWWEIWPRGCIGSKKVKTDQMPNWWKNQQNKKGTLVSLTVKPRFEKLRRLFRFYLSIFVRNTTDYFRRICFWYAFIKMAPGVLHSTDFALDVFKLQSEGRSVRSMLRLWIEVELPSAPFYRSTIE